MNYLILRQRKKTEIVFNICFILVKLCRVQNRRRKRHATDLSKLQDDYKRFGIFSMVKGLKLLRIFIQNNENDLTLPEIKNSTICNMRKQHRNTPHPK